MYNELVLRIEYENDKKEIRNPNDILKYILNVYNTFPIMFFLFFNKEKYYISHGAFDICIFKYENEILNFLKDNTQRFFIVPGQKS